ncbi:MAG: hypothetical protein ACPHY7_00635 [Gammaproteobacteria bacterium]|tara:strand:- start:1748 stop:1993 length:246 start_codon:yes stop_codon:yes gene_type:complete
MTFEKFIQELRKTIQNSQQSIGDTMMAGGVKDMENYKYLLGQAHALQLINQEMMNLLNPKEDTKNDQGENGNVVKLDRTEN